VAFSFSRTQRDTTAGAAADPAHGNFTSWSDLESLVHAARLAGVPAVLDTPPPLRPGALVE